MYRASFSQNRRLELRVEGLEERCLLSSAEYVAGLYNGILHRSPAPAEVAGWVDVLAAGASPHDVARGFTGTGVTIVTDSGQSDGSSSLMPGSRTVSLCFWKKSSPATPVGARTSATGRPARWGSMCFAMPA